MNYVRALISKQHGCEWTCNVPTKIEYSESVIRTIFGVVFHIRSGWPL